VLVWLAGFFRSIVVHVASSVVRGGWVPPVDIIGQLLVAVFNHWFLYTSMYKVANSSQCTYS